MRRYLHHETIKALESRAISPPTLARLLDCTEQHAVDLFNDAVPPNSREITVMRLCANVTGKRLHRILDDFGANYEWRPIPGFERYEASVHGQIRRRAAGHGSQAGQVLRLRRDPIGYYRANLSMNGRARSMHAHRAVCMAFHGLPPTPTHHACHRNDVHDDNRPENLYWGTATENAADRMRNEKARKIGTKLTHDGKLTLAELRKATKKTMTYRLERQGNAP